jgi:hypothetical protein
MPQLLQRHSVKARRRIPGDFKPIKNKNSAWTRNRASFLPDGQAHGTRWHLQGPFGDRENGHPKPDAAPAWGVRKAALY